MSEVTVTATETIVEAAVIQTIVVETTKGLPGPAGVSAAVYRQTFTNASLTVAALLIVNHNLNLYPTAIAIYDATGELVFPDKVEYLSSNTLSISLASFAPLSGTWQLSIGG